MKWLSALTLCFLLPWAAQAEPLNEVLAIRSSSSEEQVRLVVETQRAADFAVYELRKPDRLVLELAHTSGHPDAGPKPSSPAVSSWGVKQLNLSRVQVVAGLKHRLHPGSVQVQVLEEPHRVVVDFTPFYVREEKYALTEAVEWLQREEALAEGYLLWNQLTFDPEQVDLDVGLAKNRLDAREPVSKMVEREGALAGINGGFFARSGGPLGVVVREGKVLAPHVDRRPARTVLGVTDKKKVQFDRVVAKGRQLVSRAGESWNDVVLALGGGPRLLHRGRVALTTDVEELGPKGNDITRTAGRTAVATTRDGKMALVTASGYRDNHKEGLRLEQLAVRLLRLGASEAMNLDGGASVDMVIGETVVSDGPGNVTKEKPVATSLLIKDKRPRSFPFQIESLPENRSLPADGRSSVTMQVKVLDAAGKPVLDGTPVRLYGYRVGVEPGYVSTLNGLAAVKVSSKLLPGPARVRLECGPAVAEQTFTIRPGRPARALYKLGRGKPLPEEKGFQGVSLKLGLDDALGNPVATQEVNFEVEGEAVAPFLTDSRGMVSVEVVVPRAGGRVKVSADGIEPLTIPIPTLPPLHPGAFAPRRCAQVQGQPPQTNSTAGEPAYVPIETSCPKQRHHLESPFRA